MCCVHYLILIFCIDIKHYQTLQIGNEDYHHIRIEEYQPENKDIEAYLEVDLYFQVARTKPASLYF